MAKQNKVIIITGYPGTGKTTLGKKIAQKFNIPFICKDEIKEILFDTLGWKDREWCIRLGGTSHDLMFYFAERLLQAHQSFILETYFTKESEQVINDLKKKYPFDPVQLICRSDPHSILERVEIRSKSDQRHPGHVDHTRYDELADKVQHKYQPLAISGKCLELDTTHFKQIKYEDIYKCIEGKY